MVTRNGFSRDFRLLWREIGMMTLSDIEERAETVQSRMADIVKEMATMSKRGGGNLARSLELLDEMMTLAQESRKINTSIEKFRDMAHQLITSPCSGPH